MSSAPTTDPADPNSARGHVSVAALRKHWYVLATTSELKRRPLPRQLMGTPLVLFRDSAGQAGALLDRCPHRNVALSLGEVKGDDLQCAYHGWRFGRGGGCTAVPGLTGEPADRARCVPSHAVREQDGYVWVWATPDDEPTHDPFRPKVAGQPGYTMVRRVVEFDATLHATVENALDVPHTAFLHAGLFRGGRDPIDIQAVVTRSPDGVQVEYVGEPRPPGLAAKLMSPGGGVVTHFDRFWMPSITEVEYRLGEGAHIVTTGICTPVRDTLTRIYAHVALKMAIPGWLVKPFLQPIVLKIFQQDAWMLREQTDALTRWGGERYTSTEIDLMGPQVWRLMRKTEQGHSLEDEEPFRREVTLRV